MTATRARSAAGAGLDDVGRRLCYDEIGGKRA
jgi:hypothetical protein